VSGIPYIFLVCFVKYSDQLRNPLTGRLARPKTSGYAASRLFVTDVYFDSDYNFSSQFHISDSINVYSFFAEGAYFISEVSEQCLVTFVFGGSIKSCKVNIIPTLI
jgi:hypothetical protein